MSLHIIARAAAFVCLLLFPRLADAQIAYTCPEVPADPNLAKVSFFRLLYVADSSAPSITLATEIQGQPPLLMDSNIRGGTCSSYLPMRPNRLSLHILDGAVAAPLSEATLKEKKLTDPVKAELPPGGYRTLLVRQIDGKYTASFLMDSRPEADGPPVMRVLDLSGFAGWTIELRSPSTDKVIRTLWQSGESAGDIRLPAAGTYYLEATLKTKAGTTQVNSFECQLDKGAAFSVILLAGHRNRGAALFTFDGALGNSYDADTIKAVANSTGTGSVQ